jgi:two-component system, NtrC family, response regulator AtoC
MSNRNRLIFIVNKDLLVGNFLKYQLNGAGYKESAVFTSVKECLYVLKKGTIPAFIIADYDLGGMNGEDFLKIILDDYPYIRILFFSSEENHALAAHLIQIGASDYIHRTNTSNKAIAELIKNLRYLEKEISQSRYKA